MEADEKKNSTTSQVQQDIDHFKEQYLHSLGLNLSRSSSLGSSSFLSPASSSAFLRRDNLLSGYTRRDSLSSAYTGRDSLSSSSSQEDIVFNASSVAQDEGFTGGHRREAFSSSSARLSKHSAFIYDSKQSADTTHSGRSVLSEVSDLEQLKEEYIKSLGLLHRPGRSKGLPCLKDRVSEFETLMAKSASKDTSLTCCRSSGNQRVHQNPACTSSADQHPYSSQTTSNTNLTTCNSSRTTADNTDIGETYTQTIIHKYDAGPSSADSQQDTTAIFSITDQQNIPKSSGNSPSTLPTGDQSSPNLKSLTSSPLQTWVLSPAPGTGGDNPCCVTGVPSKRPQVERASSLGSRREIFQQKSKASLGYTEIKDTDFTVDQPVIHKAYTEQEKAFILESFRKSGGRQQRTLSLGSCMNLQSENSESLASQSPQALRLPCELTHSVTNIVSRFEGISHCQLKGKAGPAHPESRIVTGERREKLAPFVQAVPGGLEGQRIQTLLTGDDVPPFYSTQVARSNLTSADNSWQHRHLAGVATRDRVSLETGVSTEHGNEGDVWPDKSDVVWGDDMRIAMIRHSMEDSAHTWPTDSHSADIVTSHLHLHPDFSPKTDFSVDYAGEHICPIRLNRNKKTNSQVSNEGDGRCDSVDVNVESYSCGEHSVSVNNYGCSDVTVMGSSHTGIDHPVVDTSSDLLDKCIEVICEDTRTVASTGDNHISGNGGCSHGEASTFIDPWLSVLGNRPEIGCSDNIGNGIASDVCQGDVVTGRKMSISAEVAVNTFRPDDVNINMIISEPLDDGCALMRSEAGLKDGCVVEDVNRLLESKVSNRPDETGSCQSGGLPKRALDQSEEFNKVNNTPFDGGTNINSDDAHVEMMANTEQCLDVLSEDQHDDWLALDGISTGVSLLEGTSVVESVPCVVDLDHTVNKQHVLRVHLDTDSSTDSSNVGCSSPGLQDICTIASLSTHGCEHSETDTNVCRAVNCVTCARLNIAGNDQVIDNRRGGLLVDYPLCWCVSLQHIIGTSCTENGNPIPGDIHNTAATISEDNFQETTGSDLARDVVGNVVARGTSNLLEAVSTKSCSLDSGEMTSEGRAVLAEDAESLARDGSFNLFDKDLGMSRQSGRAEAKVSGACTDCVFPSSNGRDGNHHELYSPAGDHVEDGRELLCDDVKEEVLTFSMRNLVDTLVDDTFRECALVLRIISRKVGNVLAEAQPEDGQQACLVPSIEPGDVQNLRPPMTIQDEGKHRAGKADVRMDSLDYDNDFEDVERRVSQSYGSQYVSDNNNNDCVSLWDSLNSRAAELASLQTADAESCLSASNDLQNIVGARGKRMDGRPQLDEGNVSNTEVNLSEDSVITTEVNLSEDSVITTEVSHRQNSALTSEVGVIKTSVITTEANENKESVITSSASLTQYSVIYTEANQSVNSVNTIEGGPNEGSVNSRMTTDANLCEFSVITTEINFTEESINSVITTEGNLTEESVNSVITTEGNMIEESVNSVITTEGNLTEESVNSVITTEGNLTEESVNSVITTEGNLTEESVNSVITTEGNLTEESVNSVIATEGNLTEESVNSMITTEDNLTEESVNSVITTEGNLTEESVNSVITTEGNLTEESVNSVIKAEDNVIEDSVITTEVTDTKDSVVTTVANKNEDSVNSIITTGTDMTDDRIITTEASSVIATEANMCDDSVNSITTTEASLIKDSVTTTEASMIKDSVTTTEASLIKDSITTTEASLIKDSITTTEASLTEDSVTTTEASLTEDSITTTVASLTEESVIATAASLTEDSITTTEASLTEDSITTTAASLTEDSVTTTEASLTEDSITTTVASLIEDSVTTTVPSLTEESVTTTVANLTEESVIDTEASLTEERVIDTVASLTEESDIATEASLTEESVIATVASLTEESVIDTEASLTEESVIDTEASLTEERVIDTEASMTEESVIDTEASLTEESVIYTEASLTEESVIDTEASLTEESVIATEASLTEESVIDTEASLTEESDIATEASLTEESVIATEASLTEESVIATEASLNEESVIATEASLNEESVIATEASLTEESVIATEASLTEESVIATEASLTEESVIATEASLTEESVIATEASLTEESVIDTEASLTEESVIATEAILTEKSVINTIVSLREDSFNNGITTETDMTGNNAIATQADKTDDIVINTKASLTADNAITTEANQTEDSVINTETILTEDSVINTETSLIEDSVTNTETSLTEDSVINTETSMTEDSVVNTETSLTEDSVINTETSLTEDSVINTETSLTEDSVINTETSLTEDSVTNTETSLTEDSVLNTETSLTEDSVVNTETSLTEDSVINTETSLTEDSVNTETSLTEDNVNTETSLTEDSVNTETSLTEDSVNTEVDSSLPVPGSGLQCERGSCSDISESVDSFYSGVSEMAESFHSADDRDVFEESSKSTGRFFVNYFTSSGEMCASTRQEGDWRCDNNAGQHPEQRQEGDWRSDINAGQHLEPRQALTVNEHLLEESIPNSDLFDIHINDGDLKSDIQNVCPRVDGLYDDDTTSRDCYGDCFVEPGTLPSLLKPNVPDESRLVAAARSENVPTRKRDKECSEDFFHEHQGDTVVSDLLCEVLSHLSSTENTEECTSSLLDGVDVWEDKGDDIRQKERSKLDVPSGWAMDDKQTLDYATEVVFRKEAESREYLLEDSWISCRHGMIDNHQKDTIDLTQINLMRDVSEHLHFQEPQNVDSDTWLTNTQVSCNTHLRQSLSEVSFCQTDNNLTSINTATCSHTEANSSVCQSDPFMDTSTMAEQSPDSQNWIRCDGSRNGATIQLTECDENLSIPSAGHGDEDTLTRVTDFVVAEKGANTQLVADKSYDSNTESCDDGPESMDRDSLEEDFDTSTRLSLDDVLDSERPTTAANTSSLISLQSTATVFPHSLQSQDESPPMCTSSFVSKEETVLIGPHTPTATSLLGLLNAVQTPHPMTLGQSRSTLGLQGQQSKIKEKRWKEAEDAAVAAKANPGIRSPRKSNATFHLDLASTVMAEAAQNEMLESPSSCLHRIQSTGAFQPNQSNGSRLDPYRLLERSQSDANLLKRDLETMATDDDIHLTAAESSSGQNISECNRVYLDLSRAEAFERVELGETAGVMMRTSSGRLLETIPQDEELKTGDLSYVYASHRSFSQESSSSMEDLSFSPKSKNKDSAKYKSCGKIGQDNSITSSKSNLRSSFQIYSHSLKQKVRQLQMGSVPEQLNALTELNVLMEQAWSMPIYGKDLAYELCDILRTESALDIIVSNLASNNRELMKVSARLLEQSLTTSNRRQVADNGLELVVKMTHDAMGDCELAQICTGILESLFKTSEDTCSRVIKMGGLDTITYWCRCNDRVTLKNCAIALSNLALYGGGENQQEMAKHKVPEWLFPLAFVEDDSVRYYALLAIGVLVSNKEIENAVTSSGTLALVLPFIESHDPAEFAERDTSHRHGRSPGWLKRLIPVLSSKREEAQALAAFHFVMEAGIKSEQGRKDVLYKIGAVDPLKWLASTPNRVASKLAAQALKIIGEEIPHKLSQQVPLWTCDDVVHWTAQIGFGTYADKFKSCHVDGDLLLRLTEEELRESLNMICAITRKRFLRELRDLKISSDYTSCDPSMLGAWLQEVGEDMSQYTYQMLNQGVDRPLLRSLNDSLLVNDCRIVNGIHRMKIMSKIEELRSSVSSPSCARFDSMDGMSSGHNPPKTPIDVFISYRRSNGSQLASLLKVHLQLRGFTVFIDIEKLRAGKFDESLLESVRQAKNFIIVLTQNSLDRCMGDDEKKDWVHREITAAIEAGSNIIPLLDNFRWPSPESLPDDMKSICYFNAVRWIHDYQDACVDKLEKFLRGETNPQQRHPVSTASNTASNNSTGAATPSPKQTSCFESPNSPPYQRAQGMRKMSSVESPVDSS